MKYEKPEGYPSDGDWMLSKDGKCIYKFSSKWEPREWPKHWIFFAKKEEISLFIEEHS